MEKYINEILGLTVFKKQFNKHNELPLYLKEQYSYSLYNIEGLDCLFIETFDFTFVNYKKHLKKMQSIFDEKIVLVLNNITTYQRKSLVEEKIPFVIKNTQLYLPFLGLYFTNKTTENKEVEKFTPITQLVFLYLFYNNKKVSVTELAKILKCSSMTIARAYDALVSCTLFKPIIDGRKKYIVPCYDKTTLFNKGEKYLKNPIERIVYLKDDSDVSNFLISGVYALDIAGNIDSSGQKVYASYNVNTYLPNKIITKEEYLKGKEIKLELWSYNPKLISCDKIVDDISLLLSLKEVQDERIQLELDIIRRKYGNQRN